jgi:hypothetical protein
MTEDHDAIEELLAGYAMRSLDGEDVHEADRLLAEHVPTCPRCRESLAAFQELAGELGLAASPVEPPELLWARLRSDIRGSEHPVAPRRGVAAWVAAAAAIAVFGLAAWNTVLNQRLGHVQTTQHVVTDAMTFMNQPGSRVVDLSDRTHAARRVLMAYRPRETRVFLIGTEIPNPAPGREYRVWLGRDGTFKYYGSFVPDDGIVVLPLSFDASLYDEVLITEESADSGPTAPRGTHRWSGKLAAA